MILEHFLDVQGTHLGFALVAEANMESQDGKDEESLSWLTQDMLVEYRNGTF